MLVLENSTVLQRMITNKGVSVAEISDTHPTMIIFLRHLGCMFCKEALSELQSKKEEILAKGTKIVFVHMAEPEVAKDFFTEYKMDDIHHLSDPDSKYYEEFGLAKGDFKQLFGFRAWFGVGRAISKGHFPSKSIGDPAQMPGIFLIHHAKVIKTFLYNSVGSSPDYLSIATIN